MEEVVLAGVDGEHLRSAHEDGHGEPGRRASFGTSFWSTISEEQLDHLPREVPIYFYVVTRSLEESKPLAQWRGTFVEYRAGPLSPEEWETTRPSTARSRHNPALDLDEQEPEWLGYLMVKGLQELATPVALNRFWVQGRPFDGTVVRHPLRAMLHP